MIRLEDALKNVSGVYQAFNSGFGEPDTACAASGSSLFSRTASGYPGYPAQDPGNRAPRAVEVLKGPASALYGRIEPGGIIHQVTKRPRATPAYALRQQFGSFDLYQTTLDATGPLTKDGILRYRMNIAQENADSFRDFVDGEGLFASPVVTWNIGPHTQVPVSGGSRS